MSTIFILQPRGSYTRKENPYTSSRHSLAQTMNFPVAFRCSHMRARDVSQMPSHARAHGPRTIRWRSRRMLGRVHAVSAHGLLYRPCSAYRGPWERFRRPGTPWTFVHWQCVRRRLLGKNTVSKTNAEERRHVPSSYLGRLCWC